MYCHHVWTRPGWIKCPDVTDFYCSTYMEKPGAVGESVRIIDRFISNKQKLHWGSKGFPAHWILLRPICRLQLQIFHFLTQLPSFYMFPCFLDFPSFAVPFFFSPSQKVSARGQRGCNLKLRALIKTSVSLVGISCADVCVSVFIVVALWLRGDPDFDYLLQFPLLCSHFLTSSTSDFLFLRASMKHPAKTSECHSCLLCSF